MNGKRIALAAAVVISLGIAFYAMSGFMTPYVSFNDAKSGEYVQIIGALKKETVQQRDDHFTFMIEDASGARMPVRSRKSKPANFGHADRVVALGAFRKDDQVFEADKILVKCPSKYLKEKHK